MPAATETGERSRVCGAQTAGRWRWCVYVVAPLLVCHTPSAILRSPGSPAARRDRNYSSSQALSLPDLTSGVGKFELASFYLMAYGLGTACLCWIVVVLVHVVGQEEFQVGPTPLARRTSRCAHTKRERFKSVRVAPQACAWGFVFGPSYGVVGCLCWHGQAPPRHKVGPLVLNALLEAVFNGLLLFGIFVATPLFM